MLQLSKPTVEVHIWDVSLFIFVLDFYLGVLRGLQIAKKKRDFVPSPFEGRNVQISSPALWKLWLLSDAALFTQRKRALEGMILHPLERSFMRYVKEAQGRRCIIIIFCRNWAKWQRKKSDCSIWWRLFYQRLIVDVIHASFLHSRAATVHEPPGWSHSFTSPAGQTSGCHSHPSVCWNSSRRSRLSIRPMPDRLLCTAGMVSKFKISFSLLRSYKGDFCYKLVFSITNWCFSLMKN